MTKTPLPGIIKAAQSCGYHSDELAVCPGKPGRSWGAPCGKAHEMKKVALVFVLAVFVPSLVLAWLAVRSLRDQQFLLERQQSLLYQGVADAMAAKVQDALADYQHTFALKVTADRKSTRLNSSHLGIS